MIPAERYMGHRASARGGRKLPLMVLLWISAAIYMASISHELVVLGQVWMDCFSRALPEGSAKAIKASREAAHAAWAASTPDGLQPFVIQFVVALAGWSVLATLAGYWLREKAATLHLAFRARRSWKPLKIDRGDLDILPGLKAEDSY